MAGTKNPSAKRARPITRAPRANDARRRDFAGLPLGIRTGVKRFAPNSGIWKKLTRGAKGRSGQSRRRNRRQGEPPRFSRSPRKVLCSAVAGGRRGGAGAYGSTPVGLQSRRSRNGGRPPPPWALLPCYRIRRSRRVALPSLYAPSPCSFRRLQLSASSFHCGCFWEGGCPAGIPTRGSEARRASIWVFGDFHSPSPLFSA